MWDWAPTVEALVGGALLSHRAAVQTHLLSMWEPFEMIPLWTGCQSLKLCCTVCNYRCSFLEWCIRL